MADKKKNTAKDTKEKDTSKEVEIEEKQEEEKKSNRMSSKEKIELLQHEISEIMDQKLRIAAEFDNFRRRTLIEKANWIKNATERLVLEICEVRDNFERALHAEKENGNADSFKEGIELIFQQMEEVLKKEGVTKIEAIGQKFDPKYHDALAHVPSESHRRLADVGLLRRSEEIVRIQRVARCDGDAEGLARSPLELGVDSADLVRCRPPPAVARARLECAHA